MRSTNVSCWETSKIFWEATYSSLLLTSLLHIPLHTLQLDVEPVFERRYPLKHCEDERQDGRDEAFPGPEAGNVSAAFAMPLEGEDG